MKIIRISKIILEALSIVFIIVFIFIDWRISIALFLLGSIVHVIPFGPNKLLTVITGYFFIGGVVYLFIDWRIAIALIVCSVIVARFRLWANKVNYEYYSKNEQQDTNELE